MADEKPQADPSGSGGDDLGGGKPKEEKPKEERKPIPYVVFAAKGGKDAKPDELDWRVVGRVEAKTQSAAKEAVLNKNPNLPGVNAAVAPGEGEKVITDLQGLINQGDLWLEAVAGRNWRPEQPAVVQPPPRFTGL